MRLDGFASRSTWLAAASVVSRAGSLLLVVLVARYLDRDVAEQVIVAISAGIALTTVLDPQSYELLLVRPELARGPWRRFHRLQLGATACAGLLAAGFVAVFVSTSGALAALQMGIVAETYWRFRRVRHQLAGEYGRVGLVDVGLGVGRGLAAIALVVTADLGALVLVYLVATFAVGLLLIGDPLASVPVATGADGLAGLPEIDDVGQVEALKLALPYGIATTASAFYSQAPPLLVTAMAGVAVGAPLAVISRIVQPTELAAQAVSVTGLHQLSRPEDDRETKDRLYRHMRLAALGLSLLVVVVLTGAWPLLGQLMSSVPLPWFALALCAPSVIVKFQNYQAVAALLARGKATDRLRSSLLAAGLCIILVAATCRTWGLYGALGSVLTAEVALYAGLVRAIARDQHRIADQLGPEPEPFGRPSGVVA